MGGKRETNVGSKKKDKKTSKPGVTVGPKPRAAKTIEEMEQSVRVHENAGEVHFHVDDEKIKAAVPSADWYKAWEHLSAFPGEEWCYVDQKEGTILKVQSAITDGTVDIILSVKKIALGDTFRELEKFTHPG
jgi:hypothetical protein